MFHTRTYQNYGQSLKQLLVFLWVFITLVMVSMPTVLQAQEEGLENLKQTGKAFATIAREASPAVVFIKVEKTVQS
ncbi:MAG: hypothetical protein RRA35_13775, partial [Desulfomonilia bacterium]|nr:hypothetical protein [Desulfomonilia bacterium]